MLGHNERLVRKLMEHGGRQAWATVLESNQQWANAGGRNKTAGQAGSFTIHQKLKLRVEPDGEPPFETTVEQVFNDAHGPHIPQEGWSVTVIYDPNDHSKVAIDLEGRFVTAGVDRAAAVARAEMAARMRDPAARQQLVEEMRARAAERVQSALALHGMTATAVSGYQQIQQPMPDPVERLSKLADLRDRGFLTDAEFEAQKARILAAR
jgi:hypothetical protein